MKIKYGSNRISKQLDNATEIKKAFGVQAKTVVRRLEDIKASPNLSVLLKIPQANCHALKGDMEGQWAVNISSNHRLIFELDHDPVPLTEAGIIDTIHVTDIVIIGKVDYH
jgi:plasmid maintenance system killer protein